MPYYTTPQPWVYASQEHGWVTLISVDFLDIEHDVFGVDISTFQYRSKHYRSFVIMSIYPPSVTPSPISLSFPAPTLIHVCDEG